MREKTTAKRLNIIGIMNSVKVGFCCLSICAGKALKNRWTAAQLVPMFFIGSQPPNTINFDFYSFSL